MAKLIMTADDSASVRQMVSFTLKQAGYDVLEAVDGKDALTKLGSQKVDMLITDLNRFFVISRGLMIFPVKAELSSDQVCHGNHVFGVSVAPCPCLG